MLDQPVIGTRLIVLPSLAAHGSFTYRTGRLIGAARTRALVEAVAITGIPLELAVATGMMT